MEQPLCSVCGKPFDADSRTQIYCCRDCQIQGESLKAEKRRQKKRDAEKKRKLRGQDHKCGYPPCQQMTASHRTYCGPSCQGRHWAQMNRERKEAEQQRRQENEKRRKALGLSEDQYLDLQLSEYFNRVQDPTYYHPDNRCVGFKSALGGL